VDDDLTSVFRREFESGFSGVVDETVAVLGSKLVHQLMGDREVTSGTGKVIGSLVSVL